MDQSRSTPASHNGEGRSRVSILAALPAFLDFEVDCIGALSLHAARMWLDVRCRHQPMSVSLPCCQPPLLSAMILDVSHHLPPPLRRETVFRNRWNSMLNLKFTMTINVGKSLDTKTTIGPKPVKWPFPKPAKHHSLHHISKLAKIQTCHQFSTWVRTRRHPVGTWKPLFTPDIWIRRKHILSRDLEGIDSLPTSNILCRISARHSSLTWKKTGFFSPAVFHSTG